MAKSNLTSVERDRVSEILRRVTTPSFDWLLERPEVIRGMAPETAREQFLKIIGAAVEMQACGVNPTDRAFAEFGGPKEDTVRRFWHTVNTSNLPGTQMRAAVDSDMLPAPEQIIVESRTEPATGPDKFGVWHLQPPSALRHLARYAPGASNTVGGVSSVVALANCGGVAIPVFQAPLAQQHWNPASYREHAPQAERLLRERTSFEIGQFVTGPREAGREVLDSLTFVDALRDWNAKLSAVACGGRLWKGCPVGDPAEFGMGTEVAFLGCDLDVLAAFAAAGYPGLFELPMELRSTGRESECDWSFHVRGGPCSLAELEDQLDDADTPWTHIPESTMTRIGQPELQAWTLRTRASARERTVDVQLVYLQDHQGRASLFVTTLLGDGAETEETTDHVVRLAIAESRRRRPGSQLEDGMRKVLEQTRLQRTQRRHYVDRRGYAAVAQAAYLVLALARRAS